MFNFFLILPKLKTLDLNHLTKTNQIPKYVNANLYLKFKTQHVK